MRAKGFDVSKYDKPIYLFKATKKVDFTIQRLSYGTKTDEAYQENLSALSGVPVRGAYHYFSTAVPWKDQADKFLSLVKGHHFLMGDYEESYNNLGRGSALEYKLFLDYLSAQSHLPVVNYTRKDLYDNYLAPYGDFSKYALHLAQYPWTMFLDVENGHPNLPVTNKTWKMWQYGADAYGTAGYGVASQYGIFGEKNLDLIVFNGTVQDLQTWVNVTGTPVPPTPVPTQHKYVVLVPVLNVRNAPVTGSIVGALYKGNIVTGDPVVVAGSGTWLKMANGYAAIVGASGTQYMQDMSVNVGGLGY